MPSRPSSVGQTVLVLSVSEADVMIEAFNGIASVDHATNLLDLLGILEICTEIGAVGPPGLGDSWILLSHRFERRPIQDCLLVHREIGRIQSGHKGRNIFIRQIFAKIAPLVNIQV